MKPSNTGEKSFLTTKKKGNVIINPKKEDLMKETKLDEKKLDPVGKEDKDIDNDGDHDKSDRYLLNRRKVRSKVIKMREAAYDALRSKRAKKPQGEGGVDTTPDEANVGEESVVEAKVDKRLPSGPFFGGAKERAEARNKRKFGKKDSGFDVPYKRGNKYNPMSSPGGDTEYYSAKRGEDHAAKRGVKTKGVKEDVEQIDELSKTTTANYLYHAKVDKNYVHGGKMGKYAKARDKGLARAEKKLGSKISKKVSDDARTDSQSMSRDWSNSKYPRKYSVTKDGQKEEVEHITEISADKLTAAAKAAEVKRGKKAVAGDREGAVKAIAQNKKFYDAAKAKRMKESTDRVKARMIQFTKDHDQQMQGKQPI